MQGYGPITIAQGSVTNQPVDPSADRVLISNRSVYDVLVSFQNTKPLADVLCSPRWPVFVHAGDQVVYTFQASDKTPTPLLLSLGQYWSGNVWILPIGRQAGLASNGLISSSNQVFIMALHPGDATPTLAARPTNVDASSQQRAVSVPMTPNPFGPSGVVANFNTGYSATVQTMPFSTTPQTGMLFFYFFGVIWTTADSMQFTPQIGLLQLDAGNNPVGSTSFIRTYWLQGPCSVSDYPAHPPVYFVSQNVAGGATQLGLVIHNNFSSVAGKGVAFNIHYQYDTINTESVPMIGLTDASGIFLGSGGMF